MNHGEKPIANPCVLLREEFDDWAVLFDPDRGSGFGLNPTGVYVWRLLDGQHTMNALLEKLCSHAENIPEEARHHIALFVDALVAEGLATFDSSKWNLEECSYHPPEEPGQVEPCIYQPPQLVNLNSPQAAYGAACGYGSYNNFGNCGNGNHACGSCSSTGTVAGGSSCCSGSCYGQPCCTGTCPYATCCSNGAGNTCPCSNGLEGTAACSRGTWPAAGSCGSGNYP